MKQKIKNKLLKVVAVFLAIMIGLLLARIIEFVSDSVENKTETGSTEVETTPERNYYIYCYMNSGIDYAVTPKEGYYLQYSNKFLEECSSSATGYGNVYVKEGYYAYLKSKYITPNLKVYSVSSVSLSRD